MDVCIVRCLPDGYFYDLEVINNVSFTIREIDIIACVTHLRSSSKIASVLDISPKTVEAHITNIKNKINKNARESIIDFIEKSDKVFAVRKHYQNLFIKADFNKKLKSLLGQTNNNSTLCYFFYCQKKNNSSILATIQKHLEIAGVQLKICSSNQDIIEQTPENHFIYVISDKANKELPILKILQKYQHNPDHLTFLTTENFGQQLDVPINTTYCVNFVECNNYYLQFMEILKRLFPKMSFDSLTVELKQYHKSITEHQGIIANNKQVPLEYPSPSAKHWLASNIRHTKWLVVVFFILILIIGLNKIMTQESKLNKKNVNPNVSSTIHNCGITSYIPEILTGYEHFTGRKKEFQQLEQMLLQNNIVIITGQAGIGKSTIAVEFGKHYKKHLIVRHFNAEFTTKLDQQYRELAVELNINTTKQPKNVIMQLVNNKLASLATKVLFIFDNLDFYDDAKEYLINLPPNVFAVITTRQPLLIANVPHLALQDFSIEEAESYLKNSLQNRTLTNNLIQQVIEKNGTLPYDLKCIAAYLLDNPSIVNQITVQTLGSKIKNNLFKEFIVNSNLLKQHAWKILQYSAYLDPDFINFDIIKKLFPAKIELSSSVLKKLESLSLISIINNQHGQTGFKIHRKLQTNIQNSANNYPNHSLSKQKLLEQIINVMDQLFPEITFNPTEKWSIASNLQPHIEKVLKIAYKTSYSNKIQVNLANLYYKLARCYSAINVNYQQALHYAKIALNIRSNLYANYQADLAISYNDVGVIYRKIGNPQEGLKYLQQALKIRQNLYKGDNYFLAESYHTIGSAHNQNGETEKGLKYAQISLAMNKRLYGDDHYEIGCSLNLVGISYLDLGDFTKSLKYFKEGLQMFTNLQPTNYERIASFQSNIAYNYNKLGNYTEALKYSTKAVEIFNKIYPDGHPKAIYALDDLGDSLIRTNNVGDALAILHHALTLSKKFGMEQHCITAFVFHDLGQAYLKNGTHMLALKYGKLAVDLRRSLYRKTKNHHELAESLHSLGDIYVALKDKTNALKLYQESFSMYSKLSLKQYLPEQTDIKHKISKLDPYKVNS